MYIKIIIILLGLIYLIWIIKKKIAIRVETFSVQCIESLRYDDYLYAQAIEVIKKQERISVVGLQLSLRIGYSKACEMIYRMEKEGVISALNENGKRDIIDK